MTETKKNTLSLSLSRTNRNEPAADGKIRQSFSHGKSKIVAVEVKRKRTPGQRDNFNRTQKDQVYSEGGLTSNEVKTRLKIAQDALKESKIQEQIRREKEEQARASAALRAQEEQRLREEAVAREAKEKEEREAKERRASGLVESRQQQSESQKFNADADNRSLDNGTQSSNAQRNSREKKFFEDNSDRNFGEDQERSKEESSPHSRPAYGHRGANFARRNDDEDSRPMPNKKAPVKRGIKELRGKYSGENGRISIYNALDENEERVRSLSSIRRARQKNKNVIKNDDVKVIKEVILPETISVQELSNRIATRTGEVIKSLMKLGVMVTANQIIDADTAELLILELGHKVKRVSDSDVELNLRKEDAVGDLLPRPPIVTVMGHVDHGKTSLLDALRKTDVAMKEAGGITQGIGAYQVQIRDGRKITFIDTPGHAAFTEMRSRGANVTDVVVLVVAADDSVKDQTVEAINHAKAANAPIVVAINKIDKHGVNPDKVRKDLLNYNVVVESYGGDVMDVEISAKAGINLDKLEEAILLQAEILELKANPNRTAEGVVIESCVEKGLGPVATVLINKGTLRVGDIFVSGTVYGRVRAIVNDRRANLKELTPGTPGEIIGFNGPTIPGDDFIVVENEARAREISAYRDRKKREQSWVVSSKKTAEQMFSQLNADQKLQRLSLIIKADVQGASEAICSSLQKLSNDEVAVEVIHSGIGEITENDVALARASNAIIAGFNVRANIQARDQIARDKIEVRYYSVIYDLIDDIKSLLSGMLTPDTKEHVLGSAEVRQTFDVSKLGRIAGCMVLDGIIKRGEKLHLIRNGAVIHTGSIHSTKRNKDDVKEVRAGFECGILLENYNDIHIGDIIECFELETVARQL